MFATNGLASLLGISNDQLIGKSFYYCIQENCLREGVKCLESAKANDSIAYLRFWFRDPRQEDLNIDRDERMSEDHSSGDDDEGGVHLSELMSQDGSENAVTTGSSNSVRSSVERESRQLQPMDPASRTSSGNSTDSDANAPDRIFDRAEGQESRTSSISVPDEPRQTSSQVANQVELEAVVSCTSDGLVVVLRKARPLVPHATAITSESTAEPYRNGLFASPWASNPIIPDLDNRSGPYAAPGRFSAQPTAQQAEAAVNKGPATETFINSIREVAVFAWALTGINGSLAQYGRGTPSGEAQPDHLQVWDPRSNAGPQYMHYEAPQALRPHNGPQPAYMSPYDQAANDAAARRYQTYSYISGLPDTYDEQIPPDDGAMQLDNQTGGPPINGQLQHPQGYHPKNPPNPPNYGLGQTQQLPPPAYGSYNGSEPPQSQWPHRR